MTHDDLKPGQIYQRFAYRWIHADKRFANIVDWQGRMRSDITVTEFYIGVYYTAFCLEDQKMYCVRKVKEVTLYEDSD